MFKIQVEPCAQAACSSNWDSFLLMTAIVIFDFRWGHKHPQLQVWLLSCENQPIVCARVYYGIPLGKPLHKKKQGQIKYFKTLFNVSRGKQKHTLAKLQCCKTNMHVLFRINTSLSFKLSDNFQLFSVVIKYICTKYLYKYT